METAANDNLYPYIDHPNVVALNVDDQGAGAKVIKPWHNRLDEEVWIESDTDDQMIVRVPFTGSVKLRSILLKCGPGDQTPAKVYLYPNEESFDFSDASEKTPTQEFDVAQGRDMGDYAVKAAKFSNLSSVTLFFPTSQGADTLRIYYIGMLGTWTERKREAVITVYESQANLADHEKIQGTETGLSGMRFGS